MSFKKKFKKFHLNEKYWLGISTYKNLIFLVTENTGIKSKNFVAVTPMGSKIFRTFLDNGY